jgi:hypothetical protein
VKPQATIEVVRVKAGQEFDLDWLDSIELVEHDKGVGDYRLHIVRRIGQ